MLELYQAGLVVSGVAARGLPARQRLSRGCGSTLVEGGLVGGVVNSPHAPRAGKWERGVILWHACNRTSRPQRRLYESICRAMDSPALSRAYHRVVVNQSAKITSPRGSVRWNDATRSALLAPTSRYF